MKGAVTLGSRDGTGALDSPPCSRCVGSRLICPVSLAPGRRVRSRHRGYLNPLPRPPVLYRCRIAQMHSPTTTFARRRRRRGGGYSQDIRIKAPRPPQAQGSSGQTPNRAFAVHWDARTTVRYLLVPDPMPLPLPVAVFQHPLFPSPPPPPPVRPSPDPAVVGRLVVRGGQPTPVWRATNSQSWPDVVLVVEAPQGRGRAPSAKAVLKLPHPFLLRTAPKDHEPPTANRQPPTANRHQPPTIVQSCFCGVVSCPCLGHEAESVPVNVRFCWRYEPPPPPLKDSPALCLGPPPCMRLHASGAVRSHWRAPG